MLGKKLILRGIEEDDLKTLHKWANLPEIWYMRGGWHFPGTIATMKSWFESVQMTRLITGGQFSADISKRQI